MCSTCGCGHDEPQIEGRPVGHHHEDVWADGAGGDHGHGHALTHDADHAHVHDGDRARPHEPALYVEEGASGTSDPGPGHGRMLRIEQDILAKNNRYAEANRRHFTKHGVLALNLVSSPGSGKTTLLVRTLDALRGRIRAAVIEGDQQTSYDAERIRASGVRALQINTGKGCHLDAHMVGHAVSTLAPEDDSLLFIENVGNLVCPASFDLGEAHKVVVLSVTEGEDKPLKYPDIFRAADLMLLNKCDLLPHVSFDVEQALANARRVNAHLLALLVSATTGTGLDAWIGWIEARIAERRAARSAG